MVDTTLCIGKHCSCLRSSKGREQYLHFVVICQISDLTNCLSALKLWMKHNRKKLSEVLSTIALLFLHRVLSVGRRLRKFQTTQTVQQFTLSKIRSESDLSKSSNFSLDIDSTFIYRFSKHPKRVTVGGDLTNLHRCCEVKTEGLNESTTIGDDKGARLNQPGWCSTQLITCCQEP